MTEAGGPLPDITVTPAMLTIVNTEIDLDSVTLDPDPVTTAIGAAAATTPIGVNQDHSTGLPILTSPMIEAPALTTAIMTHPTADIPLTGMPPEMTADLAIDPENTTTNWPEDLHHLHTLASWKSKDRKHKQVTIDDPPSDYYSSDDNDSDSDDDLN